LFSAEKVKTMRIINADAFIKDVCNNCDGWCDCVKCDCLNCKSEHRCDFIQQVHEQPTVDAVPVKWIENYVKWLRKQEIQFAPVAIETMLSYYKDSQAYGVDDGERRTDEQQSKG
jgi:hypothetical protein